MATDPTIDIEALIQDLRARAAKQVAAGKMSPTMHARASDHFRSIVARNRPSHPPHSDPELESRLFELERSRLLVIELTSRIANLEERIVNLETVFHSADQTIEGSPVARIGGRKRFRFTSH